VNQRELFYRHLAQTSDAPSALEIVKARDCILTDLAGKEYIDLVGGISVANIGHTHPGVINAIKKQLDDYLHVMVYGEFVQSPQVQYARLLIEHLPAQLDSVYFTNSGAEAIEGAMKLAKRYTGRTHIISFNNSYHGSTQGALSIFGSETWRNAFRPLLPGIIHLDYGADAVFDLIDNTTAAVFAETIQAEAGIVIPALEWIQKLRKKCSEKKCLLVLDEVQAGFGRTGNLWGFSQFGIVPDILVLGKALGGGMPLGAFIANNEIMRSLMHDPVLGHITTFGGHPLCSAAGMEALKILLKEDLMAGVSAKENLFRSQLQHKHIRAIRSCGLLMAIELESHEKVKQVSEKCRENGVFIDWFLFAGNCLRICPPLTISDQEIIKACGVIKNSL
jgi:acetylornithine/N-succinyldiaminopimelate aminotransferase